MTTKCNSHYTCKAKNQECVDKIVGLEKQKVEQNIYFTGYQ